MEENDIIANGVIDKLIREQLISPDMATSLINDSGFSYDIQNNLIEAAEIIHANTFSKERDLSLDEDIDKQMMSKRNEVLAELRKEEAEIDRITGQIASARDSGPAPAGES